jgi:hypothetical protein
MIMQSMRRAHFSVGLAKEPATKGQDDGMTAALRKMLSMKRAKDGSQRDTRGAVSSAVSTGGKRMDTKEEKKQKKQKQDSSNLPKPGTKKAVVLEEEKQQSASRERKKEFLRNKGKKKKGVPIKQQSSVGEDALPAFGEQAERPLDANLKRRHWVEVDTPKPLTLSMKNVGSRMDSKALAALYKKSRQSGEQQHGKTATMESLKKLLKASVDA